MPKRNPLKYGIIGQGKMKYKPVKINIKRWYLVDTIKHIEPRLVKKEFNTERDVLKFIEDKLDGDLAWDVISGEEAKKLKLKFKRKLLKRIKVPVLKYEYPPEITTKQGKKSFRTNQRYHGKKREK